MSILIAIFGLAALYIIVHLYRNSETPTKNKDRRLSGEMNDIIENGRKEREKEHLERVKREARVHLAENKRQFPSAEVYRQTVQRPKYTPTPTPTQKPMRTHNKRDYNYNDSLQVSFFTSPNLYTPSSSPEHTSSDSCNNSSHISPSSSPDSTCSFD